MRQIHRTDHRERHPWTDPHGSTVKNLHATTALYSSHRAEPASSGRTAHDPTKPYTGHVPTRPFGPEPATRTPLTTTVCVQGTSCLLNVYEETPGAKSMASRPHSGAPFRAGACPSSRLVIGWLPGGRDMPTPPTLSPVSTSPPPRPRKRRRLHRASWRGSTSYYWRGELLKKLLNPLNHAVSPW